jgi:hypothetical protein
MSLLEWLPLEEIGMVFSAAVDLALALAIALLLVVG